MSFDLKAASGARISMSASAWDFMLALARAYGWQARGTLPPKGVPRSRWDGTYITNDGGQVSSEDAKALGAALSRALRDPKRAAVALQVAHRLSAHLREQFRQITGEDLPEEDADEDAVWDARSIQIVIDFCAAGAFRIH